MHNFITDDKRSARMSAQRSLDTTPELELRRALHAAGLRYFVHRRPLPGLRRTADIVFPRAKVAVFVDGCFWHGCPKHGNVPRTNLWYWPEKISKNRARDADTDVRLLEAGWTPVRVWEHEPVDGTIERVRIALVPRLAQKDPECGPS
jgi:DNA mismatch endonuclease (patch repair protein)